METKMLLLVMLFCCSFLTQIGFCKEFSYFTCGNFLTSRRSVSIIITSLTNTSQMVQCNVTWQTVTTNVQEIEGELFNVTYQTIPMTSVYSGGVFSTDGHHGNMSVIIYGRDLGNKVSLWVFAGKNPPAHLGIDQALVKVTNLLSYPIDYSELNANCYKCKPYLLGTLHPGEYSYLTVETNFEYTLVFDYQNNSIICRTSHHYTEHSEYNLTLYEDGMCTLVRNKKGNNAFLPILWAVCFFVLLTSVVIFLWFLKRYFKLEKWFAFDSIDRQIAQDLGSPKDRHSDSHAQIANKSIVVLSSSESKPLLSTNDSKKAHIKDRLKSLDCFRGLSLVIMIFVNYGGGGYWFFAHSKWNGLTVADLVFPWFMWIMGASIVFSFHGRRKSSIYTMLYQVIRRSIILFGLGLFLNNGFDLQHWRIPGVLQRFGVSYFAVAMTELLCTRLYPRFNFRSIHFLDDIINNWIQLLVALTLIIIHLMITFLLPVNGCPKGYLGPGGIGDYGEHSGCTGGAARQIDLWVFGYKHIYQHPTCHELYHTGPFEPEGGLGTLNSIALCFMGLQAGKILMFHQLHKSRIPRMITWGLILGLVGAALSGFQKNEGWIPINKNLWSLSFILVMGGTAFLLLSVMYFCIDTIKWWNGVPFIYPGMNSIMVYCGSELLHGYFPFSWEQEHPTHFSRLASNLVGVGLWIVIAYYCFRIKFFVKI
ncbi:heparan-alpha-glucosaminide N-acetyltransferase-like [Dysidea avara]|uniref:heparan-alpha-glucosaminide N-acetyltransferase-like n=1 Tax=Dysidea avara TaxID=196820 RepID=UPI00331F2BFF